MATARTRYLLCAAALAVPLSEGGHILAYLARYGGQGLRIQSEGTHAYLPGLLQLTGGVVGLLLLAVLVVLGLGRIAFSRGAGLARSRTVPLGDLLVTTAIVQFDVYLAQEIAEVLASHQALTFSLLFTITACGLAGQLPVAVLGALALTWISGRLETAVARLRTLWEPASVGARPPTPGMPVVSMAGVVVVTSLLAAVAGQALVKRGPPLLAAAA